MSLCDPLKKAKVDRQIIFIAKFVSYAIIGEIFWYHIWFWKYLFISYILHDVNPICFYEKKKEKEKLNFMVSKNKKI